LEEPLEPDLLAIPVRLSCDPSESQFGDEARVGRGKEQNVFLNRRRKVQENHDLRETRWRDVAQTN